MQVSKQQIHEFYSELMAHDWHYNYSDDYKVWSAGSAAANRLRSKAAGHPILDKMYKDYSKWIFQNQYPSSPPDVNVYIQEVEQHHPLR